MHDVAVIGGGVVGAAVALALVRRGADVEAEDELARGASGANSGLLHEPFDSDPGTLEVPGEAITDPAVFTRALAAAAAACGAEIHTGVGVTERPPARVAVNCAGLRPAGRSCNYVIARSRADAALVHVAAIRSTGLSASLGIAEPVAGLLLAGAAECPLPPVAPPPPAPPWWRR